MIRRITQYSQNEDPLGYYLLKEHTYATFHVTLKFKNVLVVLKLQHSQNI